MPWLYFGLRWFGSGLVWFKREGAVSGLRGDDLVWFWFGLKREGFGLFLVWFRFGLRNWFGSGLVQVWFKKEGFGLVQVWFKREGSRFGFEVIQSRE